MRSRTVQVLVVAVGFGLLAAYLVSRFVPPPAPPAVPVLVAKQPIPRWTAIKDLENLFEQTEVSANVQLPSQYVKNFAQIKERAKDLLVEKAMKPGEPLSLEYLIERSQGGLAAVLRPGYTGFAVHVTADSAVSGLIQPESNHVKVFSVRRSGEGKKESRLLMKNIRVVAVDRVMDPSQEKGGHVPSTITLEVTDNEVKTLRLAQEEGSLALGLISLADARDLADRKGEPVPEEKVVPSSTASSTVPVLVAREPIAVKAPLRDYAEMFVVKEVPRTQLNSRRVYFTSLEQLRDKAGELVLLEPLHADQPLAVDAVVKDALRVRGPIVRFRNGSQERELMWVAALGRYVPVDATLPSTDEK